MKRYYTAIFFLLLVSTSLSAQTVSGELKKWHKVTLDFEGPQVSESDAFNPFMNFRLNVRFTHLESGKVYRVPGYFAADGDAANTSAKSGNRWRVHFAPDETGRWAYKVQFRKGSWVAVSDRQNPGESGGYMDGLEGDFLIAPSDKTGRDFRAKGRLQYVGERYLRFAETGQYFLKSGADAPENLLSYADFDGTFHTDGHKDNLVKSWQPHQEDWKKGDPTWKETKGKGLIGALNYLASEGMNAVSFLTLNIEGDDQNVFPYVDYDTHDRFDVSRLAQWEVVFSHAQQLGLFLHFKTQEVENQGLLDNGGVGALRKLYYRELIARFGHHLALNWNMCEESGDWVKNHKTPPQFTHQRLAMAQYFYDHDPYRHHVVIHNGVMFDDILGPDSKYTGVSLQTHHRNFDTVHPQTIAWLEKSGQAGRQWALAVDEPGDAQHSLLPDSEDPTHDLPRKNALWGALMGGAWGLEWYFGYAHPHSDLTCEDWRSRDLFWDQCRYALDFFNALPFTEMNSRDDLLSSADYCFAKEGQIYVVYLKNGGSTRLTLPSGRHTYTLRWYNPRTGEYLKRTEKVKGTPVVLSAPEDDTTDWVAVVTK